MRLSPLVRIARHICVRVSIILVYAYLRHDDNMSQTMSAQEEFDEKLETFLFARGTELAVVQSKISELVDTQSVG